MISLMLGAGSLLGAGAFFVWLYRRNQKEEVRVDPTLVEQQEARRRQYVQALDASLEAWLAELGLPELESKRKREEAARQLSSALCVHLMLWHDPHHPSTEDLSRPSSDGHS